MQRIVHCQCQLQRQTFWYQKQAKNKLILKTNSWYKTIITSKKSIVLTISSKSFDSLGWFNIISQMSDDISESTTSGKSLFLSCDWKLWISI